MECPSCHKSMEETIHVCQACRAKYTNSELVEILQLEFLLAESAQWPQFEQQRAVYAQRLKALQSPPTDQVHPATTPAAPPFPPTPAAEPKAMPTSPPSKPVSAGGQWRFSEMIIKLALYAGGFLLVLAGLIFIGASWSILPAVIKLLVTLGVTGVMYGGGVILCRVQKLRVGGLALLAVAGGFAPLNFAVLHVYLLDGWGVDSRYTWLLGSMVCLLLYLGTTLWARAHLFTYMSILAALSGITAILAIFDTPFSAYVLVYALFPVPLLIAGRLLRLLPKTTYLYWPAIITSTLLLVGSAPFLIGVAIFSPETLLITLMLLLIAVLYLAVAVGTGWVLLLLPTLLAAQLVVISGFRLFEYFTVTPVTVSYAALGLALLVAAVGLHLLRQLRWAWPFYLFALFDLAGTYLVGLFLEQPWPIVFSFVFAVVAFALTWIERPLLEKIKLAPLPTYLGLLMIFIGHFYVLDLFSTGPSNIWPIFPTILCSLFVLAGGLLSFTPAKKLYGQPLHWTGLALMVVPAVGVLSTNNEWVGMITFALIGLIYIADGAARRWVYEVYLGTGAFVWVIWFLLSLLEVSLFLAYVLPLGLWLLALGWVERFRGRTVPQMLLSLAGLLVILSSSLGIFTDQAGETLGMVTFALIGLIYIADGAARRWVYEVYLGAGAFVWVIWFLLAWLDIELFQAYVLPLGLWLLALGWIERFRGQTIPCLLLNLAGLLVVLGSALGQSFESAWYAALLLVEGVVALAVGLGARSRSYVLAGMLGLVLNGLVQFLPAFAESPRFVQIGCIGTTLLGGGLVALFLRERIINVGRNIHGRWKAWGP